MALSIRPYRPLLGAADRRDHVHWDVLAFIVVAIIALAFAFLARTHAPPPTVEPPPDQRMTHAEP